MPALDPKALLRYLQKRQPQMLATVKDFVEIESPSANKSMCDVLGRALRRELERVGGKVTVHAAAKFGDHLQVDYNAKRGRPVMLLGHFDTVYDLGTLKKMPFRTDGDRAYGPGIYDMKTGIVQMLYAIEALRELHDGWLPRPITVLLVTDEEVGSESSRTITERIAKHCEAVFVCEPSAEPGGALKTGRKGVGDYSVKVSGVASHAGLDFERGQSAIVELAGQIQAIAGFTDLKRGLTVNPGVIRGGTRTNVVAAEAAVEVDVRISKLADAGLVERKFRNLKPFNKRCTLEVTGSINRPPMERTKANLALFAAAQKVAKELGFAIKERAVGGGSDGNFTSALGVATLDGLGAVGDGAHAKHEHIIVSEMPKRAALLAGLIANV